jgi:serine/threonine protein kinase
MTTRTLKEGRTEVFALPAGAEVTSGTETFLIKDTIGEGGFGTIYRATLAGTDYALKVASGGLAQKKLMWESKINAVLSNMNLGVFPMRILRDVSVTFPLNTQSSSLHPESDIVIGVLRDLSNFGIPLTSILKQENDLTSAIDLMLAIMRTLKPIHENRELQYIHGDISPENIIYAPIHDVVLFIDFGSAQRLGEDGVARISREEFSYNPLFMSPEVRVFIESQREEVNLTKASDIYSLGMIFYGLLFEPPNQANCEHIDVLVRNRINRKLKLGTWNKAVANLVTQVFVDCFAIDENSRIQNLGDFELRLSEISDLISGKAITRASIYHKLLTQSSARLAQGNQEPTDKFLLRIEDERGRVVDFANELQSMQDNATSFLFGARGSGKTSILRQTTQILLESGELIPICLDAREFQKQGDLTKPASFLAAEVYRSVFGAQDVPESPLLLRLTDILGLGHEDAKDKAERAADEVRYVLFIDNFNLLEDDLTILDAFAHLLTYPSATQFVFCGNLPASQGHIQDFRDRLSKKSVYTVTPLAAHAVQETIVSVLGKSCPERLAEALSTPVLLSLLLEEEDSSKSGANQQDIEELPLGSVFGALNRFYRDDYDMLYGELPQFSYSVCTVERAQEFELESKSSLADWLWRENQIRYAQTASGSYCFCSSVVARFLASQFVIQTIHRATHASQLSPVNHIWDTGLIAMLRAIPAEMLIALALKVRELVDVVSPEQIADCDLIPANLFALTGDSYWALVSVQLADNFFHETVLDGYFASGSELLLFSDIKIGQPVRYDLSDGAESLCTRLPPHLVEAIAADVRYGFRLASNIQLADALCAHKGLWRR